MKSSPSPLTDLLHAITGTKIPKVAALILAGGSGTRFGGSVTKQFVPLDGIPVIVRTLTVFEKSPYIGEIVLAVKPEEADRYPSLIKKYRFEKIKAVVPGGADRQESALHAFDAISPDAKYVAIHDGARCLVTEEMLKRVILEALRSGSAVAAAKTKDTVKIADSTGVVQSTPDRRLVYLASTPQVFLSDMYRAAAYTAQKDGYAGTDDASLCERLGFPVNLVDIGDENIKITTPTDLLFAEAILKKRVAEADEGGVGTAKDAKSTKKEGSV